MTDRSAEVIANLITMTFEPQHEQAFIELATDFIDKVSAPTSPKRGRRPPKIFTV